VERTGCHFSFVSIKIRQQKLHVYYEWKLNLKSDVFLGSLRIGFKKGQTKNGQRELNLFNQNRQGERQDLTNSTTNVWQIIMANRFRGI